MSLEIAIGISAFLILCFLFLTTIIGGQGGIKEHIFLRLILVFIFLNLLLLLAKSSIDSKNTCEIVVNSTQVNYNTTTYTPGYYCASNPRTTSETFYNVIVRLQWLFWIYVILYASYSFLIARNLLPWKK